MRSKLLRLSLEQCANFMDMAALARDVGATSDDLLGVLTPQEVSALEQVYSPYRSDQKWAEALKKLPPFADDVWTAIAFLRGCEDNSRVERGEAPQWEAAYAFPSTD